MSDLNPDSNGYGHGIAVAGIVGAKNNDGFGVAGVNPHAKMMILRQGQTSISTSAALKAINFAQYNGAKVINASR